MSTVNPFSRANWNLTDQGKIYRDHPPHVVERLRQEAEQENQKREKRIAWLKDQIAYLQKELQALQDHG